MNKVKVGQLYMLNISRTIFIVTGKKSDVMWHLKPLTHTSWLGVRTDRDSNSAYLLDSTLYTPLDNLCAVELLALGITEEEFLGISTPQPHSTE
jgi:hypothetical protein